MSLKLRISRYQVVIVSKLNMEYVLALLNVGDAALPEKVDDIDFSDRDISNAVVLVAVPENAVNAGSFYELIVPNIGISLLKVILLKNYRNNGRKSLCLVLVSFFSRKDIR